ncbi:hypothetical protein PR048_026318 [Dryococelus australis]|uniref:Uncharacterized protein n=1 Tax=Dryococelus australis TaxID=614101 RepID=A0ABQ9GKZ9_9NEOP|nr:hypothetical protein PR048_026318 [Dryococelus australis]
MVLPCSAHSPKVESPRRVLLEYSQYQEILGPAVAERLACSPPPPPTGEPGSIPGRAASGFSQVGIVRDYAAGRRISRFPHPCIPAMLHSHLISPSSALKTSLRAAQISQLRSYYVAFNWCVFVRIRLSGAFDRCCVSVVVTSNSPSTDYHPTVVALTSYPPTLTSHETRYPATQMNHCQCAWLDYSPPTPRRTGSFPGGIAPGFPHLGIVPDDVAGRRVFFSGISPFPPPLHSGAALCSPHFPLVGSQYTSLLRAAQNSPETLVPSCNFGDCGEGNLHRSGEFWTINKRRAKEYRNLVQHSLRRKLQIVD